MGADPTLIKFTQLDMRNCGIEIARRKRNVRLKVLTSVLTKIKVVADTTVFRFR